MIFDLLEDRRPALIGRNHWLGNLRWMVEEIEETGAFVFRTAPLNTGECDLWKPDLLESDGYRVIESKEAETSAPVGNREPPAACRTFFGLQFEGIGPVEGCCYRPDHLEVKAAQGSFSLLLPLENYGALLEAKVDRQSAVLRILSRAETGRYPSQNRSFQSDQTSDRTIWSDGAYTLVFRHAGELRPREGGGFDLGALADGSLRLAVAFHVDKEKALAEAERLFVKSDRVRQESRESWESYFRSCPVAEWKEDFSWQTPDGQTITYSAQEIIRRQYWHWHCLLSNVYDLPFNDLKAYMAPDKTHWFGVWSNDGPECLRALSHTNQTSLARRCLAEYVRTAITAQGDLGWYLHGTGIGCLGNPGDSGIFSNGVPAIVSAVAEYVQQTGDDSILDEPAGEGGTVWEKLKSYMVHVFDRRDLNADGMVEWANLWEGGPDDKVGPFFSKANLKEWIQAVTTFSEEELKEFYRQNLCPVVNLYEQNFFLSALKSLEWLAQRRHEIDVASFARERYERTCATLEDRHWNEEDGFYYDWDCAASQPVRIKNADAFYMALHLKNPARVARLFEHLENREEFNQFHIPTLARNEKGFNPRGYWSGGYWPREAVYIGGALLANGYRAKGTATLIKALCAEAGKLIPENMNPLTGEDNTRITGMAYNVLTALALVKPEIAAGPACSVPE